MILLLVMLFLVLVLANALGFIRFLAVHKDGGPYSTVTGYWLIEIKWLFSVALLRFGPGSRENFHNHAFNCVSWVLGPGQLQEQTLFGGDVWHKRSWRPLITLRSTFHRVFSHGTTWVLTFRGPWRPFWTEYDPKANVYVYLTKGRRVTGMGEQPCSTT